MTSQKSEPTRVLDDNNAACALLNGGNYVAAHRILHRALLQLSSQLSEGPYLPTMLPSAQEPTTSFSYRYIAPFPGLPEAFPLGLARKSLSLILCTQPVLLGEDSLLQSIESANHVEEWSRGSPVAMYNRAYLFSYAESRSSLGCFNLSSWTMAIIFYNSALVHHNEGLHKQSRSSAIQTSSIRKALKLYKLSLEILTHDQDPDESKHLLLLYASVLNNMGHCHALLYEVDETRRAFMALRPLLGTLHAELNEDDYAIFFLNSMMEGKSLHLASAA